MQCVLCLLLHEQFLSMTTVWVSMTQIDRHMENIVIQELVSKFKRKNALSATYCNWFSFFLQFNK